MVMKWLALAAAVAAASPIAMVVETLEAMKTSAEEELETMISSAADRATACAAAVEEGAARAAAAQEEAASHQQAADEAKVAVDQLAMEVDESGRRLAVLSTQLDEARSSRDEEKINYTQSLETLDRSVKALERVLEDPRLLPKEGLLALKRRPDWDKELADIDSLDLEPAAASGHAASLQQILQDVRTKLSTERSDLIDRESAARESFTELEPQLLAQLAEVKAGLDTARGELRNLTKGVPQLQKRAATATAAAAAEADAQGGQQGSCDAEAAAAADVEAARRDEIAAVTAVIEKLAGLPALALAGNETNVTSFRNFSINIDAKHKEFTGVQDIIQKTIQRLLAQQAKETSRHFYCKQQVQLAAQALASADVRLDELTAANKSLVAAYALATADGAQFAATAAALSNATVAAQAARDAAAANATAQLEELGAAVDAVTAAKQELSDFYAALPGGAVKLSSTVDLLDGLQNRLEASRAAVERGEAKERAAFAEADRTRRVALAEAQKAAELAAADAAEAAKALPETEAAAADTLATQNATRARQQILEDVCTDPPTAAAEISTLKEMYEEITGESYNSRRSLLAVKQEPNVTEMGPAVERLTAVQEEIAAELATRTAAYEAGKAQCEAEEAEAGEALAAGEDEDHVMAESASAVHTGAQAEAQVAHDAKALADARASLAKMEAMRAEEHESFLAEEKELADAVETVDAALGALGNATLVQRALSLRKQRDLGLIRTDLSPGGAQVRGVLAALRDDIEGKRQQAVNSEEAAAEDFEALRVTKLESIDALAAQVTAQTETAVAAKGRALDAQAELEGLRTAAAAARDRQVALKKQCVAEAAAFREHNRTAQSQLSALAEALITLEGGTALVQTDTAATPVAPAAAPAPAAPAPAVPAPAAPAPAAPAHGLRVVAFGPAPAAEAITPRRLRGARREGAGLLRITARSTTWQEDVLAALASFEEEVEATQAREAEAHKACTEKTSLAKAAQADVAHELAQAEAAQLRAQKTQNATAASAAEVDADVAVLEAEAQNASADLEAARQRASAQVAGEETVQRSLEKAISLLKPHAALGTTVAMLETMVQQSAEAAAAAWSDFADVEQSLRAMASKASTAAGAAATRLAQLRGREADQAAASVAGAEGVAELEAEQSHLTAFTEALEGRCGALLESFATRREARAEELRGLKAARATVEAALS